VNRTHGTVTTMEAPAAVVAPAAEVAASVRVEVAAEPVAEAPAVAAPAGEAVAEVAAVVEAPVVEAPKPLDMSDERARGSQTKANITGAAKVLLS
jgi:hypothetical protein